jgi:hypothetical protein
MILVGLFKSVSPSQDLICRTLAPQVA